MTTDRSRKKCNADAPYSSYIDKMIPVESPRADDYLNKPYENRTLRAHVRALLRRGRLVESQQVQRGNVILDRAERSASVAGVPLNLTAKEFALLEYFIVNRGKTLSRKQLLRKVWRFDFDPGTNMVDVNIARLRGKLVDLGASCRLEARRGVGYAFAAIDDEP